jgi:hypothetical protein
MAMSETRFLVEIEKIEALPPTDMTNLSGAESILGS